jgi:hypothetical protein
MSVVSMREIYIVHLFLLLARMRTVDKQESFWQPWICSMYSMRYTAMQAMEHNA